MPFFSKSQDSNSTLDSSDALKDAKEPLLDGQNDEEEVDSQDESLESFNLINQHKSDTSFADFSAQSKRSPSSIKTVDIDEAARMEFPAFFDDDIDGCNVAQAKMNAFDSRVLQWQGVQDDDEEYSLIHLKTKLDKQGDLGEHIFTNLDSRTTQEICQDRNIDGLFFHDSENEFLIKTMELVVREDIDDIKTDDEEEEEQEEGQEEEQEQDNKEIPEVIPEEEQEEQEENEEQEEQQEPNDDIVESKKHPEDDSKEKPDPKSSRDGAFKTKTLINQLRGTPYPLSVNLKDVSDLGNGVYIFFNTIKYLLVVMGLFSILALLDWVPQAVYHAYKNGVQVQDWYKTYRPAQGTLSIWIEFGIAIIYILLIWVQMTGMMRRWTKERSEGFINPATFSVHVDRLPNNVTPLEVAEFFSEWGCVISVVTSQEECEEYLEKRRWIIEQYLKSNGIYSGAHCCSWACCTKKMCSCGKPWEEEFAEVDAKLQTAMKHSGHAFVTFRFIEERNACLKEFKRNVAIEVFARLMSFITCGCWVPYVSHFKGSVIRVRRAPRFSDIAWENLRFGMINRFLRRCLSISVSVIIIATSFSIQVFIVAFAELSVEDGGAGNYVQNSQLISIARSAIIIVLNTVVRFAVEYLVRKERHWSHSGTANALLRLGLWVRYINTSVVPMVVNILFPMIMSIKMVPWPKIRPRKTIIRPPDWYTSRGGAQTVFYVMLLSVVNPAIEWGINVVARKLLASIGTPCASRQQTVDRLHAGPRYDQAPLYASLGNLLFLTMTFGTSMPILYPMFLLALVTRFWYEKIMLLRAYQKPPPFDDRMPNLFRKQMKWGLVMHGITLVMFYNFDRFFGAVTETLNSADLTPVVDSYPRMIFWLTAGILALFFVVFVFKAFLRFLFQLLFHLLCIWMCTGYRKKNSKDTKKEKSYLGKPYEDFPHMEIYAHPISAKLKKLNMEMQYEIAFEYKLLDVLGDKLSQIESVQDAVDEKNKLVDSTNKKLEESKQTLLSWRDGKTEAISNQFNQRTGQIKEKFISKQQGVTNAVSDQMDEIRSGRLQHSIREKVGGFCGVDLNNDDQDDNQYDDSDSDEHVISINSTDSQSLITHHREQPHEPEGFWENFVANTKAGWSSFLDSMEILMSNDSDLAQEMMMVEDDLQHSQAQ